MKKILILGIFTVIASGLVACGKSETGAVASNSDEINAYMQVLNEGDAVYDFDLADSYKLEEYFADESMKYTFTDLNGDGVQEMLLELYGNWMKEFTYRDGKVIEIDNPFYSGATGEIVLNNNIITLYDENHEGRVAYIAYKLNAENVFEPVIYFEHDFPSFTSSGEDEYVKGENDFDNPESITEEEFSSLVNQYSKDEKNLEWSDFNWEEYRSLNNEY